MTTVPCSTRVRLERRIVRSVVSAALARGYTVSVSNGEEWVVKSATELRPVLDAIMSTDEEVLRIRSADKKTVIGSVFLVYGNGGDVINDYTANDNIEELLVNADKMSERAQARLK